MSLHARDVRWTRSGRLVLDGVTVAPEPGATVGLLGPNGSGKSSLLKLLAGVDRPDAGTVHLDGAPVATMPRRSVARRLAMVAQHNETELHITVRDVVRLGRIPYTPMMGGDREGTRIVEAALTATGLDGMPDRLWHTLSGGERQRVQIARALAQDPEHLLLDEPTNHLDIAHQLEILALVRTLHVTTVVALHDLNLAAMFCDHLVVLSGGAVVAAGTPGQVLTEDLIAQVYGVRCQVSVADGVPHVRFEHRAR
ncbi:ABC transporter ATP-binding protein [Mycolicibacterium diernhoferi]|uniref:ABC transporter ATP-binding protein n=1 Tax=Mycolicibacterium diernhoferi TaxID=1801 RepID=A0A1Q4HLD6_9MYCO|nr:ABC transporter ATP-binding protein [Mycolicibacterium diernhoferi]OJZ68350.1 histidinol phosphatase [Mycolicibacterium diernhoferi]OPE55260.1 histidinol phosphatase [Mycolicibacterium diernhoferi]PEG51333.1 ABC transporter ATP-binding protein [Mycolicibacterium diernhoferi]QYL21149.1 ABC transporter ATP-binding protein [Mycolicibacterium diernhoferi]